MRARDRTDLTVLAHVTVLAHATVLAHVTVLARAACACRKKVRVYRYPFRFSE